MRRLLPIFLLGILPATLLAQKTARISGRITNGASEAVLLSDPYGLDLPDSTKAEVRSDGSFTLECKAPRPHMAILVFGEQRIALYLSPGDAQEIAQNTSGGVEVSGAGGSLSQALNTFHSTHRSLLDSAIMHPRLLAEAVDVLELELYDARKAQEKQAKELLSGLKAPDAFQQSLLAEARYNYDRWLLAYPVHRANARKGETEVRNLPATFEESFDAALLDNPAALGSRTYREYVWYYTSYFAAKGNGYQKWKDQNAALIGKCNFAQSRLKGEVASWLYAYAIGQYMHGATPGNLEYWMTILKKSPSGSEYAAALEARVTRAKELAEAKAKAKPEDPAKAELYKFRMLGLDGKEMNLSDYAGKVVYIDFWASWCGPCRQQFPHSKRLKETIHTTWSKKEQKEIVFLYISIDQDEDAWRKAITDLGIEGEHGFSNAKWQDGAGSFFGIQGIPRYMVMDKKGKIVVADAPRPSSEDILDMLKREVAQ